MENSGPQLLRLNPSEEIIFNQISGSGGDLTARVQVANISADEKPVIFKIKTTSPEKFRVRPSMANLPPNTSTSIEILVQASSGSVGQLVRDKFLITAVSVDKEGMNYQQIADLMKVKQFISRHLCHFKN